MHLKFYLWHYYYYFGSLKSSGVSIKTSRRRQKRQKINKRQWPCRPRSKAQTQEPAIDTFTESSKLGSTVFCICRNTLVAGLVVINKQFLSLLFI